MYKKHLFVNKCSLYSFTNDGYFPIELGVKGFDFGDKGVPEDRGKSHRINLHDLMIHLWPGDWKDQLSFMNGMIEDKECAERDAGSSMKKMSLISEREFWIFFGLMLAARLEGRVGTLWDTDTKSPDGILRNVNYSKHMSRTRFNEIRHYMAFLFADKSQKGKDDWWQVLGGIDGFNENRKKTVQAPKSWVCAIDSNCMVRHCHEIHYRGDK